MSTILIRGGAIITMNSQRQIQNGDIYIQNDRIAQIGADLAHLQADKIIDARGMAVIPGLIQTHIHLTQTIFRGQADDMELLKWLQRRIWPLEAAHDAETNYYSAKLGIAELIKGGTTAIADYETVHYTSAAIEAIYESGFRAVTGKVLMDDPGVPPGLYEPTEKALTETLYLMEKWHMKGNGRIRYSIIPRFVLSCTEELLKKCAQIAKAHNLLLQTHASESRNEVDIVIKEHGMRNISYLHKLGLTGPNVILAHCIWADEEEKQILKHTGTKVAHCPNSNLKLASGIAPIPEYLKMGVQVSIGADGTPCNNNLDAFGEMRAAALIQKGTLLDPTVMPAEKVFEMATIEGAKALGQENEIGSLEPGKKADIAIVDMDKLHEEPATQTDIIKKLVYASKASDVVTTIVNGKILMENRKLMTLNEREIKDRCNRLIVRLVEKAGIKAQ